MSSQLTVYKASAGSGKTFTLAREYMTLVIANPALALKTVSCELIFCFFMMLLILCPRNHVLSMLL
jgi:ATP-dependent exoDNAse (exonuclease V) beta subunit